VALPGQAQGLNLRQLLQSSGLAAHLNESLRRIERLWELHFLIMAPAFIALSQFEDLHRQLVEANFSGDTLTPQRLLHTTDTSFLNADRALWQLSRKARTLPTVRAAVEHLAAHEVMTALESYVEGQIFLAELRAWLSRYGMRSHGADGLSDGSWIDDPLPAIQHLQALLRKPDRDLEAEVRLQTVKCAAVVGQVRQRLTAHPSRVRYEQALAAAQMANFLSMEHNFWIDQQAMWCLRRVYLELGRRGVETGKIDQRDDVFFLIADEAQTLLRGSAAYGLRELVAMRRAQIMQARAQSAELPWLNTAHGAADRRSICACHCAGLRC
jgi:hypothetical protein